MNRFLGSKKIYITFRSIFLKKFYENSNDWFQFKTHRKYFTAASTLHLSALIFWRRLLDLAVFVGCLNSKAHFYLKNILQNLRFHNFSEVFRGRSRELQSRKIYLHINNIYNSRLSDGICMRKERSAVFFPKRDTPSINKIWQLFIVQRP